MREIPRSRRKCGLLSFTNFLLNCLFNRKNADKPPPRNGHPKRPLNATSSRRLVFSSKHCFWNSASKGFGWEKNMWGFLKLVGYRIGWLVGGCLVGWWCAGGWLKLPKFFGEVWWWGTHKGGKGGDSWMVKEMHSANKNSEWNVDEFSSLTCHTHQIVSSRFWEPTYCSWPTKLFEGGFQVKVLGDSIDSTEQLSPTSSHDATNE